MELSKIQEQKYIWKMPIYMEIKQQTCNTWIKEERK